MEGGHQAVENTFAVYEKYLVGLFATVVLQADFLAAEVDRYI